MADLTPGGHVFLVRLAVAIAACKLPAVGILAATVWDTGHVAVASSEVHCPSVVELR
jgi:hypothetical protein